MPDALTNATIAMAVALWVTVPLVLVNTGHLISTTKTTKDLRKRVHTLELHDTIHTQNNTTLHDDHKELKASEADTNQVIEELKASEAHTNQVIQELKASIKRVEEGQFVLEAKIQQLDEEKIQVQKERRELDEDKIQVQKEKTQVQSQREQLQELDLEEW